MSIDASDAAAERARTMPLTPVDPPASVIRTLEDAALARIDVHTARRLTDLDRRFDRTVSSLRQELARRQEREPEEEVPQPAIAFDTAGFLLATIAVSLLIAGGREGPVAPAGVAAALLVAASASHVWSLRRARRRQTSVASARYLVLLTALISFGVALLLPWRPGLTSSPETVVSMTLSAAAGVVCAVLYLRAEAGASVERRAHRARLDAERGRRADLEVEHAAVVARTTAEADEVIRSLSAEQRGALTAAIGSGVKALARRQLLEPETLRELRRAEPGRLRYDVGL